MVIRGRTVEELAAEREQTQVLGASEKPGSAPPSSPDPDPGGSESWSSSSSSDDGGMSPWKGAGIALAAVAVTVGSVWGVFALMKQIDAPAVSVETLTEPVKALLAPDAPMKVLVTLDNKCPYSDESFMVKVTPSGLTAAFYQGKATVQALPTERVRLIANTRYPDFQYETGPILVKPEITLVADCESVEDRMKATSEGFRETFKKP
ncbi:MAG: hypothetical protein RIR28_1187 [Pseudomonadota bacterium]|jgi:hypothetical protein